MVQGKAARLCEPQHCDRGGRAGIVKTLGDRKSSCRLQTLQTRAPYSLAAAGNLRQPLV